MKKVLSFFAAILMILAAGCEKQDKTNISARDIPNAFTAKAEITFRETFLTAQITRKDGGELNIKILSPDVLAPLEINCKNGECTASYDGISFNADSSRFPQADFANIAAQAFDYVQANIDLKKTVSEGIVTYQGSTDNGVFILNLDSQSGAWLDLSVEGAQLHVVFKEFTKQ